MGQFPLHKDIFIRENKSRQARIQLLLLDWLGNPAKSSAQKVMPMSIKDFGPREGEKTVELPEKADASLYFIGKIRTPWKERKDCPKNARESDAVCTVELDPRWQDGLKDVATCSHVVLLYWMDKSPRTLVLQVP